MCGYLHPFFHIVISIIISHTFKYISLVSQGGEEGTSDNDDKGVESSILKLDELVLSLKVKYMFSI